MMRAKWRGKAEFAEVAETLGIDTAQVLAHLPYQGAHYVYWSSHTQMAERRTEDMLFNTSLLRRDNHDVLQVVKTIYDAGTVGDLIP